MSVRHAILAFLSDRSLSGYDLKLRFDRIVGELWQLNSGQVYTTLERLLVQGAITRHPAPVPACPERATYTITKRGQQILDLWFRHPELEPRPFRDPAFVRLAVTPPDYRDPLFSALETLERRYRDLQDSIAPLLSNFPLAPSARARWLVLDGTRMRIEAEIKWLSKVRATLQPGQRAATG